MYAILVLKLGFSPEYVMDKMDMTEVASILKYQHYAHSDEWEQSRLISFVIGQVNSKKKLKPSDIIDFSWDNANETNIKAVSNEEVKRLREKAKAFAAMM